MRVPREARQWEPTEEKGPPGIKPWDVMFSEKGKEEPAPGPEAGRTERGKGENSLRAVA